MLIRRHAGVKNSELWKVILIPASPEIISDSPRLSTMGDVNRVACDGPPLKVWNADILRIEVEMVKAPLLHLAASVFSKGKSHADEHVVAATQV